MRAIYQPQGRAREYSHLAINHYGGCSHGCDYCYARDIDKKFKRADRWENPEAYLEMIEILKRQAVRFRGTCRRVLLSFMTDPYQPLDETSELTRAVIKVLRSCDIPFQILTKGGTRALRDFDLYGQHDAFATTMTFLNPTWSRAVEPGAASPKDRLAAIQAAKSHGIETWVSLEPVISPLESLTIIDETHEIVDLYKIGTLNHRENKTNWRAFGSEAIDRCQRYGVKYYIKDDLAKHLSGVKFKNTDTRTIDRTPRD